MTRKYLYGIIPTDRGLAFGLAGFPPGPQPVYTVGHQGLGAVVSDYRGEDFATLPKESQLRCLLAHQSVIEGVMEGHGMPCPSILPVKFGTLLADDGEVQSLLERAHPALAEALARMEGSVEVEVAATWDLPRVLAEIGQEEEIQRLRQSIASSPPAEALADQIRGGRMVKEALDHRREAHQQRIVAALRPLALEVQPNVLVADAMVMNVAFLIPKQREPAFEERVRELDREFGGAMSFRVIGPLPPYSFATVTVTRPGPEKVEEARQLLGLAAAVTAAEVKGAYRRRAAALHPDAYPSQGPEAFASVREAYTLLADYCQAQGPQDGQDGRCSLRLEEVKGAFIVKIGRPAALLSPSPAACPAAC